MQVRVQQRTSCLESGLRQGVHSGVYVGVASGVFTAAQRYSNGIHFSMRELGALSVAQGLEWGCMIGFFYSSKCALAKTRGKEDVVNSVIAGASAGGLVTAAKHGRYWRYNIAGIRGAAAAGTVLGTLHYLLQ
ncbi:hypothetical protein NDN08_004096 [Rhodosorus marinus]|uniref:Mitochondrial import inner membrane translocase subunit TIM22 n=1 Tax=Rhodosorus marinus TaxID=101924 RepID=A0AAV8UK92_9RHOD|nr:hypothetical protein NDN08_004096 [Rhodosorus marinus]